MDIRYGNTTNIQKAKPTTMVHARNDTSQVLRRFLKNSSVKGLPNIFKSETLCQRSLWIACLVIGNGIGIFFLIFLFIQYFRYETSITTTERFDIQSFPDISVCNLNPILTDLPIWLSYQRHLGFMHKYGRPLVFDDVNAINYTNLTKEQSQFFHKVMSVRGYFQNLPPENDLHLETVLQDFVLKCAWMPWPFNDYTIETDCYKHARYFYSHHYGPCFTLSLDTDAHAKGMKQMVAVLYISDRGQIHIFDHSNDMQKNYAAGARVLIHPRGTLPDMQNAITASPGHETTMDIYESFRTRLDQPYGKCREGHYLPMAESYV